MKEETKRSAEMRQVLEEYKASGLSRRAFCEQRGMALTTLDYWVREQDRKATQPAQARRARLVKVEVAAVSATAGCFTISLGNGRQIANCWSYADAELARLIRVAYPGGVSGTDAIIWVSRDIFGRIRDGHH